MQKKSEDLFDEATRIAGSYRAGERPPAPGRKTPAASHAPAPPVAPPVTRSLDQRDPKTFEPRGRDRLLPAESAARKTYPIASGFLDYFSDAVAEVSHISYAGNDQHNKGQPLHWARGKSMDHADTLMRHFVERGTLDTDGQRHSAKMAWRAMAILQQELEDELNLPLPRGAKNDIA